MHARAQEVSLDRRSNFTRLARAQEASLERRTSLKRKKRRSSKQSEASGLQRRSTVERKSSRSREETHHRKLARAQDPSLERRSNNPSLARAQKPSLERRCQILDNNHLFQHPTNMFQTYLTHPKTQIQGIKGWKQDIDNNMQPQNPSLDTMKVGEKPGSL